VIVGVIGGSGFIGRHLCNLISNHSEDTLVIWSRESHGDFLSRENRETFLDSYELNLLYQLSWTTIEDDNYRRSPQNALFAEATLDLVRSCIQRGLQIIVVGTASQRIISEKDEYLKSKEVLRSAILELNEVGVTLVRPTFVFSIEDRRPHLFRTFMKWIEEGNSAADFPINFPKTEIDFVHVEDVAESLYHVPKELAHHSEVIIASGLSLSVYDAVKTLNQKLIGSVTSTISVPFSSTPLDPKVATSTLNQSTLRFFGLTKIEFLRGSKEGAQTTKRS
jgi:nucleoside-diphosphate-sugar epimerase